MAYDKSSRMTAVVVAIVVFLICVQIAAVSTAPIKVNRHHSSHAHSKQFHDQDDPMLHEFYIKTRFDTRPRLFRMVGQLYPLMQEHQYVIAVVAVCLTIICIMGSLASFYAWYTREQDDRSSSCCKCTRSCSRCFDRPALLSSAKPTDGERTATK